MCGRVPESLDKFEELLYFRFWEMMIKSSQWRQKLENCWTIQKKYLSNQTDFQKER
jgi:hypothetical protein